jgi:hypothetical protein
MLGGNWYELKALPFYPAVGYEVGPFAQFSKLILNGEFRENHQIRAFLI